MPDHDQIQTTPDPVEEAHEKGQRGPTPSQVAAAVEAAYILEAVRK
ncbi:MAG TPA: hypothetical protein VGE91_04870 [Solirubrobacterales bacterium]|jgi:hypothetical protein